MPRRLCLLQGPKCSDGGLALPGASRCAAHSRSWRKSLEMQARSSLYDSPQWRERRKRQLAEFPYCAHCGAMASIADHIENIGAGGSFEGPLQSLCRPCHAKKTAAEGGRAAKAKRRGDSR